MPVFRNNFIVYMNYHIHSAKEVADSLHTSIEHGLSPEEAAFRHEQHGGNELPPAEKQTWLQKVWHQLKDVLVLILVVAAVISFALGDYKDGIVISVIVIANAIMGLLQQAKAENAIAALQQMSLGNAKVFRSGNVGVVPIREVVPGDIIVIEAGDKVPADARVIESVHLRVAEAALTGESKAVEKYVDALDREDMPLGDRTNMLYKDSVVTYGRGRAVVTVIGVDTEIGRISQLLRQQKKSLTPLELELNRVGKVLTVIALLSAIMIFVSLFFLADKSLKDVFFTAMSIAIAVVPEGIPTVVTTVLAIAVTKLAKRNAIVRKMSAVESLGSTTQILTDKTGTLTKNEMTVTDVVVANNRITVTENGEWIHKATTVEPLQDKEQEWLLTCSVLCNDTQIGEDNSLIGDPTETSLVQAALDAGMNVNKVRLEYERVDEIPFSSDTKRMIVVVKDKQHNYFSIAKGAAEVIHKRVVNQSESIIEQANSLSENGIRTLAFSYKALPKNWTKEETFEEQLEEQHTFIGLMGLKDPLRPEVKVAVEKAASAGIQTVMITGDHKLIATSIGKELGIVENDTQVQDGSVLGDADVEEIKEMLKTVRVFSRVSPEQKLRIVKAAQANGNVVAVTGDGVNDAPAMKTADIGVAMGISGTDVTKEVADVVLRDDNYSTIVGAVHQGRIIFGNFIKFLRYQISCNLSGVFIIFFPTILGFASPLLPIHILLLNLVSETGPSIALGLEKGEKDVMEKPPRKKSDGLLTKKRWKEIIGESILLTSASLAAFVLALQFAPYAIATVTLTTAFFSRLWHAFNSRSETHSVFSRAVFRNKSLERVVLGTLAVFLLGIYTPIGNTYLSTVPLSVPLLGMCIALSVIPIIGVEIYKAIQRKMQS